MPDEAPGAMWGMDVIRACLDAASGNHGGALEHATTIERRLDHAGVDALPDLLLVPAVSAHVVGDDERARPWSR